MSLSLLTITKNRTSHLKNLFRGLARSQRFPAEAVVVVLGGEDPQPPLEHVLLGLPFPVNFLYLEAEGLVLARARNRAYQASTKERLIFLDVDCIPSPELIGSYDRSLEANPASILMGQVNYLPKNYPLLDISALSPDSGAPHPDRDFLRQGFNVSYDLFWSLSFALHRSTMDELGGFDESFHGYGGEDTDFAWSARDQGVPLVTVPDALAYHQYHGSCAPPLDHFSDIIKNAEVFKQKWGVWPMGGWLEAFKQHGLLEDFHPGIPRLRVCRTPTGLEIEAARLN
jgi:N-acetylglucosaminyl-diphospho-decaprenol L-rhamnosyltransferase